MGSRRNRLVCGTRTTGRVSGEKPGAKGGIDEGGILNKVSEGAVADTFQAGVVRRKPKSPVWMMA